MGSEDPVASTTLHSGPDSESAASTSKGRTPSRPKPPAPSSRASLEATASPRSTTFDWTLSGRAELGASPDGTVWAGGALQTTLDLGGIRPGILLRVATNETDTNRDRSGARRVALDVLVGGDFDWHLAPFILSVGGGIGAGWLYSQRVFDENCGIQSACADAGVVYIPDGFTDGTWGLRAELRTSVGFQLSSSLRLVLTGAATLHPLASEEGPVPQYASTLPAQERLRLALSPEPSVILRGGLGLVWEGL